MILQDRTLKKLRELINEETQYRKGSELVDFFNALGGNDYYGQGFPSRWVYTDQKLQEINGTPKLDQCIKNLFAPINFIDRMQELDAFISDFNRFLAFEKWRLERENDQLRFIKLDKVIIPKEKVSDETVTTEIDFLAKDIPLITVDYFNLDFLVTGVINCRLKEIEQCIKANIPFAAILLSGSCLEGLLLGFALKNQKTFNQATLAPKDKLGKVCQFHEWKLTNLIDVACEIGILNQDVKTFSHGLRDFRNYIHPNQQVASNFQPNEHTATICWQVLKAALHQMKEYSSNHL
jgi:hypothetical protein